MAILRAGVRYDLATKTRQAVVVILDDGHDDHIIPHQLEAQARGEGWIDIPANVYSSFGKLNSTNSTNFASSIGETIDDYLARVLGP